MVKAHNFVSIYNEKIEKKTAYHVPSLCQNLLIRFGLQQKKMQIKAYHVSSLYQTITNNALGYGCQAPWIFVVQNVDEIANTNQRRL